MRLCRPGGVHPPVPQIRRPDARRLSGRDGAWPQTAARRRSTLTRSAPIAALSRCAACEIRFKVPGAGKMSVASFWLLARKSRNREEIMIGNVRLPQLASAALGAYCLLAGAPASAQGVKIGILNDQSGTYADYGGKGSIEAAKMAIEDFGGSVLGQTIDLVTADHQNKPDLAGNIARRWYDVEGVDMLTDLTTSSVALAVQGIAAEKKKIDIVVGAATSAITGAACTPYGFHWAFDTHALAASTGGALVKAGGDTWLFVTVDYAFGHALEKDTSDIIKADGGKVLGSVLTPLNSPVFSSFLLQAQSSKAKIVGLANAGADTVNSIKQ